MKILRNSPDLLIVEDRPIFFAVLLGFFTIVTAGVSLATWSEGELLVSGLTAAFSLGLLGVISATVKRTRLTFQRSTNMLELRQKSMRGMQITTHKLSDLDKVEVGVMRGESDTYRLELVFAHGMEAGRNHPVTDVYTSGVKTGLAADAINGWLSTPVDSVPRER